MKEKLLGAGLLTTFVVAILIPIIFAVGWVMNVVKFIGTDFDTPYKAEVVRAVGIVVAPIGGIIGYIDIKD